MATGNPPQVEFQAVIDHRAILPDSLFVPLAELQLGHSLAESGNQLQAAALFQELSSLWRASDATFPPYRLLVEYKRAISKR